MPTRKQRRRMQKERRHEQAWYEVDEYGNEVEIEAPEKEEPSTEPKARAPQKKQGGSDRPVRVPPEPSWGRAFKRAGLLGIVIFAAFYLVGAKSGGNRLSSALLISVIYTAIFVPFTYWIDRFSHNRWLRRVEQQGQKRTAKNR